MGIFRKKKSGKGKAGSKGAAARPDDLPNSDSDVSFMSEGSDDWEEERAALQAALSGKLQPSAKAEDFENASLWAEVRSGRRSLRDGRGRSVGWRWTAAALAATGRVGSSAAWPVEPTHCCVCAGGPRRAGAHCAEHCPQRSPASFSCRLRRKCRGSSAADHLCRCGRAGRGV